MGSGDCLTTVSDTSTVSVSSSGGKCIYTFTNGGNSLTPPAGAKRIDFLVVGAVAVADQIVQVVEGPAVSTRAV